MFKSIQGQEKFSKTLKRKEKENFKMFKAVV